MESTSYASSHFIEADEAIELLSSLESNGMDMSIPDLKATCVRLEDIFEKYQEQPTLLDPFLERLVAPLLGAACSANAKRVSTTAAAAESDDDSDQQGDEPAFRLEEAAFHLLYILTKVRGYKTIIRMFSHEVNDFHRVLAWIERDSFVGSKPWEAKYVLLLWLSALAMIPFDMPILDGKAGAPNQVPDAATDEHGRVLTTTERVMAVIQSYLQQSDLSRDAAAVLAGRFCGRPDLSSTSLPWFLDWALDQTQRLAGDDSVVQASASEHALMGLLSALAAIFKLARREHILPYAQRVQEALLRCNLLSSNNTAARKLHTKLVQRLGLAYLRPVVASWRYQRGARSLKANLRQEDDSEANDGATKTGKATAEVSHVDEDDVPEDVEEVIDQLAQALRDKDTIVRWSAAKGIGRVTGRLPRTFASDVIDVVVDLFDARESDAAWHAGCLSLAELGRRGLLLPEKLARVMPVVLQALAYDVLRGSCSVGAHVRDAACYVCWAFARAYDSRVLAPHMVLMAPALLRVALFDREITVRRAASAAFQENVGRQGTIPYGIDIVAAADYFAVGNRHRAYTHVADLVASFPEYAADLLEHLCTVKLLHWDIDIRKLSAEAIQLLYPRAAEHVNQLIENNIFPTCTSVDLNEKHGAILGLGFALHAAARHGSLRDAFSAEFLHRVAHLPSTFVKAGQLRGMGGALVRQSLCTLLAKLGSVQFRLAQEETHEPFRDEWQQFLLDCLDIDDHDVQAAAAPALAVFLSRYFEAGKDFEMAISRLTQKLDAASSTHSHVRRAYAQVLGHLPSVQLRTSLDMVVTSLLEAAAMPDKATDSHAEARAEAFRALSAVCRDAGDLFSRDVFETIGSRLCMGMEDYAVDSRGDIGSGVRESAMAAAASLVTSVPVDVIESTVTTSMVNCMLCQASEKIDRTRACACAALRRILESIHQRAPGSELDRKLEPVRLVILGVDDHFDWQVPGNSFPRLMALLNMADFAPHIVRGLVVSIGGLTESLVRTSRDSLLQFMRSTDELSRLHIGEHVLEVLQNYTSEDRLCLPCLKTFDVLFTHGVFDGLEAPGVGEMVERVGAFASNLCTTVKVAAKGSSNVSKLINAASVYCGLLAFEASRRAALTQIAILLGHRYPRVRRAVSELFYLAVLTLQCLPEDAAHSVMDVLMDTVWDDQNASTVREYRNRILRALDMPVPKLKSGSSSRPAQRHVDELDSYRDLVDRAGY